MPFIVHFFKSGIFQDNLKDFFKLMAWQAKSLGALDIKLLLFWSFLIETSVYNNANNVSKAIK